MQDQLLLIHVDNNQDSSYEDQEYLNMLIEKDYEMLDSISKDKKIQNKIKNKDLSIIIVNQRNIH